MKPVKHHVTETTAGEQICLCLQRLRGGRRLLKCHTGSFASIRLLRHEGHALTPHTVQRDSLATLAVFGTKLKRCVIYSLFVRFNSFHLVMFCTL